MARAALSAAWTASPWSLPGVQERAWDWDWWHPMWGVGAAWGVGMLVGMLVFWGLVLVGLVLGIRWLIAAGRRSRPDAALEILRQRYARGEIDREEFEARKRDLGG